MHKIWPQYFISLPLLLCGLLGGTKWPWRIFKSAEWLRGFKVQYEGRGVRDCEAGEQLNLFLFRLIIAYSNFCFFISNLLLSWYLYAIDPSSLSSSYQSPTHLFFNLKKFQIFSYKFIFKNFRKFFKAAKLCLHASLVPPSSLMPL